MMQPHSICMQYAALFCWMNYWQYIVCIRHTPWRRCSLSIVLLNDRCTFVCRILFGFFDLFIHSFILFCFGFPFAVYLQTLSTRLSQISPAFDPSRSENTSDACKRHTRQFIDALHRFELWAFQSNFISFKHIHRVCVCDVFFCLVYSF